MIKNKKNQIKILSGQLQTLKTYCKILSSMKINYNLMIFNE